MPIKTFTKEYPEHGFTVEYTFDIYEMPKVQMVHLSLTGRIQPTWLKFDDLEVEKFEKFKKEMAELEKACDRFVERSPKEVADKKIFGIGLEILVELEVD